MAYCKACADSTLPKNSRQLLKRLGQEFPDLTLATDVIVGYPGETEEAFSNTFKLMKEVEPDVTNVSKFFARPKTAAWDITDGLVDKEED